MLFIFWLLSCRVPIAKPNSRLPPNSTAESAGTLVLAGTPRGSMSTDLNGLTLIDLAGLGPSARCVRALADFGARWIRACARLLPRTDFSAEWHSYGALRGAQQPEFDLKHADARALYLRLVQRADIIVEGFRPGVADRLGIGYRDVRAVNERIVYCAATGYGQTGPLAQDVGHDINYQALAGGLAESAGAMRKDYLPCQA